MIHIWDAVEADFLRDYKIQLMDQIDDMTWRQFLVLLNNLSPHGAVAARIRAYAEKKDTETTEEQDEKAANAFFSSIVSM